MPLSLKLVLATIVHLSPLNPHRNSPLNIHNSSNMPSNNSSTKTNSNNSTPRIRVQHNPVVEGQLSSRSTNISQIIVLEKDGE